MLAFVRYDDGGVAIVPTELIRDFAPGNARDFVVKEKKKVYWTRKKDGHMRGFYNAEILVLGGKSLFYIIINLTCSRS